ncbi:MAG: hypothetical protein HFI38_05875 [Lachnospiraceae bacterium]|jgi:neutral ceramidase|nr:hypothetical protein [Lachnospiraceae bacterium]
MLKVSTATVSITPTKEYLPCYVSGNALRTEKTDRIHDELECSVLVIQTGGQTMIWGVLDLIFVDLALSSKIRRALSETYHAPYENIVLAGIHTHSGPEISEVNAFGMEGYVAEPGYRDFLMDKCMEATARCYDQGFTEATPYIQTLMIDGLYGNRNGIDKPSDKSVTILKFRDKEGRIVAGCVNLSCHPTLNDPLSMELSGDLFGYLSRGIQSRWGVSPLMLQGACGDMGNRQYRQGAGFDEIARVGDGILKQIDENASPEEAVALDNAKVVPYHYHDEYDRDMEAIRAELEADEKRLEAETDFDQRKLLICGLAFMKQKAATPHVVNEFDASIIRLGDLEICQIPAELFSCLGLQIKNASRAKHAIIWGYTNDDYGYLVEDAEYDNCYEGRSTSIRRGEPERLTKELAALMAGTV